jgi:hypothetical protein
MGWGDELIALLPLHLSLDHYPYLQSAQLALRLAYYSARPIANTAFIRLSSVQLGHLFANPARCVVRYISSGNPLADIDKQEFSDTAPTSSRRTASTCVTSCAMVLLVSSTVATTLPVSLVPYPPFFVIHRCSMADV